MSDSFKFWEEQEFPAEKTEKELTNNLKDLLLFYNTLSLEEKIEAKGLIREQKEI